jgi:hypothetical protein
MHHRLFACLTDPAIDFDRRPSDHPTPVEVGQNNSESRKTKLALMPSNEYATWTFDDLCQEYEYWSTIEPSDEAKAVQEKLWAEIQRRLQRAGTLGLDRN